MTPALHSLAMAALVIGAGAWRWFDGTNGVLCGIAIPTWLRNGVTLAIALAAAYVGFGHGAWIVGWYASCATLSVVMGFTKWEDPAWQFFRFAAVGALAVSPMFVLIEVISGWKMLWWLPLYAPEYLGIYLYPFACGLAGLAYTYLREDRARWILGATVVGGLVML